MATRTIYATIRIDLKDDTVEEITDEQVETFVEETLYNIPSVGTTEVEDTTWEHTEY